MYIEFFKKEMNDICELKYNRRIIPILVDFDSTVVYGHYPYVGDDNEHCVDIMKRWIKEYNVGFILNTMRSDEELDDAIKWFNDRNIPLYGVGKHPTQEEWTTSNKAYGIFSIDDINVGTPLIYEEDERPRVDWLKVDEIMTPVLESLSMK